MKAVTHRSAIARRTGIAAILVGVALVSSACAVGQHAATATDRPAIDGTVAQLGQLKLENISIQAPNVSGRPTGTSYYVSGDDAPMTLILVNNGHTADTLTGVSSPDFTSWAVAPTTAVGDSTAIGNGSTSQAVPPGGAVQLGLSNLGVGTGVSPNTLVLRGLTAAVKAVYPGTNVKITFTFANSGSITVNVPVQLTAVPNDVSVPAPAQ